MLERYGLTLTSAPATEPVTTAEAKAWLRQDHAADDTMIEELVKSARQLVEQETGLALITQTWRLTLDDFPEWEIELPRSPLASVSSITYVDSAGATQTLDAAEYESDETVRPGIVQPSYGNTWPAARCQAKSVQITFVAGYGAASAVPAPLKQAVKALAGFLYENGGALPANLPEFVKALVTPFRDGRYP